MATLAAGLRPLLHNTRAILGKLGFRQYRVYLVQGIWSGTHTGAGNPFDLEEELTVANGQPVKVRQLNDEQITVGGLALGTIEIGPITPAFPGGGYSADSLLGRLLTTGDTATIKLVGPSGTSYYVKTRVETHKALRYMIQARPVGEEPGIE